MHGQTYIKNNAPVYCQSTSSPGSELHSSRNTHSIITSHNQISVRLMNVKVVEEWKTNLMSRAILFHFLCGQHVSDINISIIRSLRLCGWITTSVVFFSVRCVLELLVRLLLGGVRFAGWFRSRDSVLPLSTQVRGFKPGRNRQDFSGRKNPQHAFLRRGSKAVSPMS